MASSEWGSRSPRCYSRPRLSQFAARYSLLNSLLPIRYSPFATRSLFIRHPEGWAERRWRSDACEAPVSACHDRHADASLDRHRPPRPACVLCAPRASPACDRFPHIGQAGPICGEASCVPSDGTLAFRRSTWDFWPGPVLAVVRHPPSLKLRRASPPQLAASAGYGTARQSLGGGAAVPPGSCGDLIRRTGHRYPEEQVSRASPARPLTASGDTTASLRLTGSPLEAPLMSEDGRSLA
jgi:hypothetical protein